MRRVRLAVKAFLAGTMISIGGTLYINLVESNKVAGAILFAVGLVTICAFGLSLFTGMAGYLLEGKVGQERGRPAYGVVRQLYWVRGDRVCAPRGAEGEANFSRRRSRWPRGSLRCLRCRRLSPARCAGF